MNEYQYRKIDAFTAGQSLGNPAACIYLDNTQTLTDCQMLTIAKQHKGFVSEVVFCREKSQSPYHLTYYSSECEVDFCGHGTIACIYNLITENPFLMSQKEIAIQTNKKGLLNVYNEIQTQDSIYITSPVPRHIGTNLDIFTIAANLGLKTEQISDEFPCDVIDAGLKTLIVPISDLNNEINIFPDIKMLQKFCLAGDIDIILIFSTETANNQNIAHTRVFAPLFGYLEDPATGSGNSAFGYYMLKNNLWDGNPVAIEQGGSDRIYNSVKLQYKENRVLFGGKATRRIKGVYYI